MNTKSAPLWNKDLYGLNHRQDLDQIPDSNAILLKNISLSRPGNWAKRKGTALLGVTQVGIGVFGLSVYDKNDGTHVLRAIRDRDLDVYSSGAWTEIDANQFTASTQVSSTNYLNRVYHTSTADYLCYESGGTCTDVGTGNDRLRATTVTAAQRTLFVGGVTYGNGSAQTWQDRVYFSLFDNANGVESHQLWETSEGSLANSTRFFGVNEAIKSSITYNNAAYFFTQNKCWTFNMRYEQQNVGPEVVFDEGIAGLRACCVCRDMLISMNPRGQITGWRGAKPLAALSWDIEDDEYGQALISAIDPDNLSSVAAGAIGNMFIFSVGDITFLGETIENACIVGWITQNQGNVLWSIYSFPTKPAVFANVTIDNKETLVYGTSAADLLEDVFEMNTGGNDNGTAIDAFARAKFFDFGAPVKSKEGYQLYVQFKPQPTQHTYLQIGYAQNGDFAYTAISDPDATSSIHEHGIIDMYDADYATKTDAIGYVAFPAGVDWRNISLEVGNSQLSESFEIKALGIVLVATPDLDVTPDTHI